MSYWVECSEDRGPIETVLADFDAFLVCLTDKLPRGAIERLSPRLRVISTFSVGTEHIDAAAARERGIAVGNAPHGVTIATAEIAMLLILGAARRAPEGERLIARLRDAPAGERISLVVTAVQESLAQVMGLEPDRVDPGRPLTELGLDSLMAFEFKERLEGSLGAPLSLEALSRDADSLGHPRGEDLAPEVVAQNLYGLASRSHGGSVPACRPTRSVAARGRGYRPGAVE